MSNFLFHVKAYKDYWATIDNYIRDAEQHPSNKNWYLEKIYSLVKAMNESVVGNPYSVIIASGYDMPDPKPEEIKEEVKEEPITITVEDNKIETTVKEEPQVVESAKATTATTTNTAQQKQKYYNNYKAYKR